MGCWFRREQLNSASRFSSLSQSLRSWHMQTACNLSEDTNIAQTHGKNYMPHIFFLFWVLLIVNTAPRSRRRGWALWRRSEGSLSREGRGSQTAEMKESRARKSLPMSSAVVIFRPPQPSQDAAIRKNNARNLSKETKCEHTQKNQHAAYPEIIWVQLTWPRSELSCSHADAPLLLCPPTPGRSADLHLTCLAPP